MNYSAISIQGNIVSSEILEKIRTEDIRFQKAIDFNLNPSASIRDEINLAWSLATSNWNAFKQKRENLSETDTGTTETRRFWIIPLLSVLGYEMTVANAEMINGKSYAISHRSTNRDGFPIHIVGVNQSLDKRPETGTTRLSPHALVQEYLNNNEHLYGLVSNGRFLRVLRDATRLSRLSYLEFDLQQMMEEGLYVEFALLYRALHASRMPEKIDVGADSVFEFYHQEAISSGSRIRERLSLAVESSIKELANGLLYHPQNEDLRQQILENKITAKNYYLYTLRLVYRMLFLLVIEERKLIYPEKRDEELNKKRGIYYDFYSLQRLTKLAEKLVYVDPRKTDLWQSLLTTFALFEDGQYGKKLGIDPLGSGLFSPSSLSIINDQLLDNECLLKVLRYLVTFENEKGQRTRVNYADLDVEEFGSVYEGLLEYAPVITDHIGQPIFSFEIGDERSSSGSHYTPEELVKPLITHSLDYLIADKLKEQDPEAGLLSLTVCDVACGSGHILLSAARRIGFELAKYRSKEDQPAPTEMRKATRDVIRNCIYGVDLNPLAVELCKVALWLEAHDPGQPMNFLDHHIKCGNAIVGLAHFEELDNGIADEAFKTLPGDEKEFAATLRKKNALERNQTLGEKKSYGQQITLDANIDLKNSINSILKDFQNFVQLPEGTPQEIANKEKAYNDLTTGKKWFRIKQLADMQVAQFFIPKTLTNKDKITTEKQYRTFLNTGAQIIDQGTASAVGMDKHFFHWFLEFPQVFQDGGFDCILGNPPFKGGKRISTQYGDNILNYLTTNYAPHGGITDLVAYFFRRNYHIINSSGYTSLISTNTIAQGDTRIGGLKQIILKGGTIVHAIKSMQWPGIAAVFISMVSIKKGNWNKKVTLNSIEESFINSYLDPFPEGEPTSLIANDDLAYIGSYVLGQGFVLNEDEMRKLISQNSNSSKIIKPYLNGKDLNTNPHQKASRYIIDFKDLSLEKAKIYTACFQRIKELVYPERIEKKEKKLGTKFWQFARRAEALYKKIDGLQSILVIAQVSKTGAIVKVDNNQVFDAKLVVFTRNDDLFFGLLQSSLHIEWAWRYGTTMKTDLSYGPTNIIGTFPLPENDIKSSTVEDSIKKIETHRNELMSTNNIGLTKLYNGYHTTTNKSSYTINFENLRSYHRELDFAVLSIYNWQDIKLRHDFYEVEYLPENDRVRYTVHPEARKEVLKRLLLLNHERYDEEIKQGLHKKADVVAFYKQKGKPIPEGTKYSDVKTKAIKTITKKASITTNQHDLFDINTQNIMKEFSVHDGIYTIADTASIINKSTDRVRRWFDKLSEVNYEGLDMSQQLDIENRKISFHGLIELVIIGELLEEGFGIRKIFKAREDLIQKTKKSYPFATNDVNLLLKISGSDITWEFDQGNVTLNGTGQINLDLVREFFRDIEFDTSGIAQRIVPSKGLGKIEITPKRAGGKPAIISQQGVQVETILKYYDGPDSIDDIISDYGISKEDINAAIAFQS